MLRACDLFLLTTEPPESFGIVLIEAMACGLPAIATDYPGVRAVVDEGADGHARPAGRRRRRRRARSREMIELGAEGRERMGAAGREKAEREWDWPRAARPHGRRLRRGDRGARGRGPAADDARRPRPQRQADPARRLLLSRPARTRAPSGRPRWRSTCGALGHQVTVLTTSAYGSGQGDAETDVVRTADAQLWRARLARRRHDRLPLRQRQLLAAAAPAEQAARARAARRRLGPVRPAAGEARCTASSDFDCVITTSPPESVHTVGRALQPAAAPAGSPTSATPGPSSRCARRFPTGPQRRLDEPPRAPLARRRPTSSPASASRPPTTCATRGIADPELVPNGADPELLAAADPASVASCSTPSGSRSSTPAASAASAATRRSSRRASPGWRARARSWPAKLELAIAGPLTEDEARLFGADFSPARGRPARLARARAGAGPAARRRRPAPDRPAAALAAGQLQALRVPGGRAAGARPGRRHGGGADRRRSGRRDGPRRRPGRRSPPRSAASPRASSSRRAARPGPPTPTRPSPSAWSSRSSTPSSRRLHAGPGAQAKRAPRTAPGA